jgi:hypothetical protein
MRVEDLQSKGSGWLIRLDEKGGKQHMMPCHHALPEALHAYIGAAGIGPPGGQEDVPVPHVARPRRHGAVRSADDRMVRKRALACTLDGRRPGGGRRHVSDGPEPPSRPLLEVRKLE